MWGVKFMIPFSISLAKVMGKRLMGVCRYLEVMVKE
jgi:hypothetical protein